jgi:hypothetical protein
LGRRVSELVYTFAKLGRMDLPNFGTISLLFSYVIQASAITPDIRIADLNSALAMLCFAPVAEQYGLFFFHELDLNTGDLPGIIDADDDRLLRILKVKRRVHHSVRRIGDIELNQDGAESITWPELINYVADHDTEFLYLFTWEDELIVDDRAIDLFERFTREYWMSLSIEYVDPKALPAILCVKDAIEWWSVESFRTKTKHEVEFMACNAGLTGAIVGRKHPSFQDRRKVFFPGPEVQHPRSSLWNEFKEHGGYLEEYHNLLRNEPEEVIEATHEALDVIFSKLQCLPSITNKAVPWSRRLDNLKLKVVVNPLYYKIKTIKSTPRGKRAPRVTVSSALLKRRIFKTSGAGNLNEAHLSRKRARRIREYEDNILEREARREKRKQAKKTTGGKNVSRRGRGKNYRRPPGWVLDVDATDSSSDSGSSPGSIGNSESETSTASEQRAKSLTPPSSDGEDEYDGISIYVDVDADTDVDVDADIDVDADDN